MVKKFHRRRRKGRKTLKKIVRRMEIQMKPELKNSSSVSATNGLAITSSNTYVITNICAPAQGTSSATRVGDKIRIKKIEVRLTAFQPSSSPNFVRMMIIHDRRWTGTDLTGAQILTSYNLTDQSWINAQSSTNIDYVNKHGDKGKGVDILYDKVITLGTYTATAADQTVKEMNFTKTYTLGKVVQFAGGTSATGQLFLVVFPGNDTTAGSNPNYVWFSNVYYTDA